MNPFAILDLRLPIWNKAADAPALGWFKVVNKDDGDAEILIYDQIGKDWFSEDGVNAKDFDAALKGIPANKNITVRINSPGGNVWDGLAIYNMLKNRKEKVTCRVDGIAASIASVIACAGKSIEMPANAMMMIHDPSGLAMGDAEDMRKMADVLDQHADVIANVYATRSGKGKEHFRNLMKAETWMTADDAKGHGLCDCITEEVQLAANFDLSRFRLVPTALVTRTQQPVRDDHGANKETSMDRAQIIALLKEHGVEVSNDITNEQLLAKLKELTAKLKTKPEPAPAPAAVAQTDASAAALKAVQDSLKLVTDRLEGERKTRITAEVTKLVENNQVTVAESEKAIARAIKDETYLDELRARPVVLPGAEPVAVVDMTNEDPRNIGKAIENLWGKGIHTAVVAMERAKRRAEIINRNLGRLLPIMDTNTVSSDLKRTVILQQMIRAFAVKVLRLNAFSAVLNSPRLEGTDKIAVPYFPLNTTASVAWNASNGYRTSDMANTNSDAKVITVDKRQWAGIYVTSSELARQPFLNVGMGLMLLGEQLGLDVVNDVLAQITVANFGASVKAEPAGSFDSDDVADLKGTADGENWPESGRSLMLNSAYDVNLLKDPSIKHGLNFGDTSPIREGRITRLVGFDYYPDARVPANSENLEGFICHKSALLVGFSPIGPVEEVRAQLTRYEVVTEPTTGAVFEYRAFGDPILDQGKQTIESNYGKAVGEADALKRITNQ